MGQVPCLLQRLPPASGQSPSPPHPPQAQHALPPPLSTLSPSLILPATQASWLFLPRARPRPAPGPSFSKLLFVLMSAQLPGPTTGTSSEMPTQTSPTFPLSLIPVYFGLSSMRAEFCSLRDP